VPVPVDAIVYVTEPPSFVIEDGLVHITQQVGNLRFERIMRYRLFLKTIQLAKEAVEEYERRGVAEVIPFPKAGNGGH